MGADEAEGWLNEKATLASSDEVGDTLAAVQVCKVCTITTSTVVRG